ncbi:MAG TPA: neutral/alkaline non-lysosomal ceramidase N-terminal domain-containing protein [Candidatus Hydrogenedens sp.]|nr:neutral/alkaline non-lysosomal ceramidase N-terminal domain-containing protein [Candidatus Hydrogenedens sp.]
MVSHIIKKTFLFIFFLCLFSVTFAYSQSVFKAGFAMVDITPPAGVPMWGYGARHDLPSEGTKYPLNFKVVVFDDGTNRLAVGGMDLGRSPTQRSMEKIIERVKKDCGVSYVMLVGSHTHHGPVIELINEPDCGQGKFDKAIQYVEELENKICIAISEATAKLTPAKIGWTSEQTDLNRNRVSKKPQKMRDPELTIIRIDTIDDKPITAMINFSAHAVLDDIFDRRWSSDWAGIMQKRFEELLNVPCIFLQGSAGDMSPNTNDQRKGMVGFGNAIGEYSAELYKTIHLTVPTQPLIQFKSERFTYPSRMDTTNSLTMAVYKQGFFPELINALLKEFSNNTVSVTLTTALINKELALVGGSGEFFSGLAIRLKANSPAKKTIFLGYCNGHSLYIPTVEAIEEGGYGADPMFSWVPAGTGEELIDKACANIKQMLTENLH